MAKPPPPSSLTPKQFNLLSAKEVLAKCGYPTETLVLDNEAYHDSEFSLKRMSTMEYVCDSRWEDLGWSYKLNQEPARFVGPSLIESARGGFLEEVTVILCNAPYDALVLARRYGIRPKYIVDVLSLARHWHSRRRNDLGTLCKRFGLPDKGNTADFAGVTQRRRIVRSRRGAPSFRPLATQEQLDALAAYAINDAEREYDLFNILLPRLSNPEVELRLMRHTLDLWLQPRMQLDFEKGKKIILDMNIEVAKAVQKAGMTREEASKNSTYEACLATTLKVAGDDPRNYMKPVKGGKFKFADAKADEALDLLVNHDNEDVRNVINARRAVKSWPLHISRVQSMMDMAKASGGSFPVPLKYHGAHTGRWSGTEGINPQNLGSRGHELIASVRNMIVAPPGSTLVIADAAQIEARVLDWVAGQEDSCEKWRKNVDQYSEFAGRVLGYPVRKPSKADLPAIAKRLGWARNSVGKVGVLGCGYGMGATKAVGYAQGAIDLATAEQVVKTYRGTHKEVVKFWYEIEKAFKFTAKYQQPAAYRGIRFDAAPDCNVVMTLPNGREIKYHNVKIVVERRGEKIEIYNEMEHRWEHTWGGSLTENIVQAMSRDILAESMLRCEDRGVKVSFHCHDELVAVVPEAGAANTLVCMIEELSREPVWAAGIPLGAEGCISEYYKK